ncbi:hypothetical protein I79_009002 [Cricetulus griseus]|uniref:Uncharacterized protein n=1 Tax=Cricetulus griseus TaxID=10029 RepID=G3HEL5_CRIGR|nr:hypothetical protein I79_009002 [Cricetulus griseus]
MGSTQGGSCVSSHYGSRLCDNAFKHPSVHPVPICFGQFIEYYFFAFRKSGFISL